MENITRLNRIPEKLIKAHNVAYLVIDGLRLEKALIIEKAKREAEDILLHRDYLSESGIEELENIMRL